MDLTIIVLFYDSISKTSVLDSFIELNSKRKEPYIKALDKLRHINKGVPNYKIEIETVIIDFKPSLMLPEYMKMHILILFSIYVEFGKESWNLY